MSARRIASSPLRRTIVRLLALVALVAVAVVVIRVTGHGEALHREWVDRYVVGHGLAGRAAFIALTAAITAAGFPRHLPCLLAGYAFGFLEGTLVVTLGTGLGASLAVIYARLLGRSVVPDRIRRRLARVESWLAAEPFTVALLLRVFPVGSNLATNLVAGVMRVPLRPFLLGSLIGFLPQNAIFALMGSGFRVDPLLRIGLSVVLLLASALLGHRLYQRLLAGRRSAASEAGGDSSPDLISRTS